jgi:hypothetical protein
MDLHEDHNDSELQVVHAQTMKYLYEKLPPEERDELLQCLLIAATRGGDAMIEVLEQHVLCCATEELLEEHGHAAEQA